MSVVNVNRVAEGTELEDRYTVDTHANRGTVIIDYDFLSIPDDIRIYYGPIRIFELYTNDVGHLEIPFGPGPYTTITIVMNEGNGEPGTYWLYTGTIIGGGVVDKRIACGGEFTKMNGLPRNHVTIVDSSGVLDRDFDPGADGSTQVYALGVYTNSLQSDLQGKVVVGGDFKQMVGVSPQYNISRLLRDGAMDRTFNAGVGPDQAVRALAVQPDGKVIMGGFFTNVNLTLRAFLARLNLDGKLDFAFNPGVFNGGPGLNGPVLALALQPDGKTIVGGQFSSVYGASRNGIARVHTNGTVDVTFAPGAGANGQVRALALQSDGRVVIGGDFTLVNNTNRSRVARLNADGTLDLAFNPGLGANAALLAVAVQGDGKILIGGLFTNFNGVARAGLARLNVDGTLDATFNPGTGANDYVSSITVQPDGLIVVGGGFTQFNNQYRHRLARLTSTGAFDPTVNFGVGANNFVNTLLLEPDHQILVGGGFTDMDRQPCVAIARINGGTNVGNGSFYLSATSYSVSEAGTNAQITVLRGGGAAGAVSVQYATADGTAHTPTDYTGTNGTLTFQPAENVQTITVTVSNNTIIDGNRTFGISIFNPSVGVVDTLSNAVVTIVDNDCVLSFTSTNYLVAENAGGARISVARQGALDQTVTVDFTTTTNGTATANLDYIPAQGRLTFGPGMRTLSFEVPVLDDGVSEFDESVGLLLTNAVGPVTLVQSNAWLTIVDVHPSPGILTFTLTNYTVMENGTNALITVIRTNGHSGVVSVNFATYDGTATNNLDYRATNGVLVFAENETNKTFTVPIINRTNSLDGDRIVSLVLSAPSGGAMFPTNLGATNLTATLTIIEDEVPMAKFSLAASNYTVGEAAGLLTVTVNRSGQTNGVVSVDYGTVPTGSAVAGLDYTPVVGTLFWASNDVAPKTFTVPIVDNTQVNPDRTFMVFLQNPLAPVPWLAQLLSPSNAIVRIVNDDSANPPTGGTDTTFGDHWFANSNVHAVVFDDAAQLIVGGDFTYMHGLAQGHISRLTTNALVDTSFATGQGFDNSVYALAPNTTNVLAVGGNFTNYNGVSAGRIIVLQANGLPDPTFNFGSGVDGPVRALGWTAAQSTNFAAFSGQGTNNSYTQTIPLIVDVGTLSMNYAFTPPYVANPTNRVTYTNTLSIRYGGFPIYTTNVVVTSNAVFGSIVALPFGPGGVPPTIAIAVNAGRTNGCPWSYDGVINYGGTGGRALYLGGNFLLLNGQVQTRVARVTMNGAIDMGFNVGAGPNATVLAIAPLASGQVLIGGEFTTVNNYAMPHLARLNVDGSLDTTFRPGSGYGTDKPVRAIVVQADGSIIIGGDFQSVGGVPRNGVTRLNPDGSVDLTFDPGLGASGSVYSLALQPDGLVIVVGDFTGIGGNSFTRLARLNANGSVDSSFNPGTGANALVRSTSTITQPVAPTVLTLPTATGTATADFRTYETGASNGTVAIDYAFYFGTSDLRIYYDGSLIYELATNGFGQTGPISYGPGASTQITIVVNETGAASYTYWSYTATVTTSNAPDVRVALGGDFTRVNDLPRRRVAVLNGSGVPVPSFDPGTVGNIAVYSIGVFTNPAQPSLIGKIVAGGDFTSIEGALQNRLARLNFDGTIDPAFDIGTGPDAMVRAVAVQADGMVLAGGSFKNVNGVPRAYLARFRANGMVDATYNAGTGPDNAINALALPPDGRPFIGGVFTHVYGLSRSGVARLKQDGTVDPSFDPGMGANNGTVKALALPLDGMSLFVGGDFTSVNSQGGSARLARLFTNGAVDTTFVSPLNNGTVNALAVQTDGKVLVGGTFTLGANVNLARLNSDGTVDGTFTTGTGANDYVSSITIQPDGLILVGGGFTMFNGQMHQRLVRLNHDGSFDGTANFGLGANNFINDVKLQGFDGKIIVGGAFTEFDGQVRIGIARIFSGTNLGVGAFQFSAPAFSVNEDASNAVITVVRVGGATGAVRVNFATSDGTAVAGRDYVATAGTLYFATGESAQTISVVPINNSLADGTRGFNLTLSNPGGGAALGASNTVASVSILDDESVISFSVSQYSVLSDAGSARISVTRTGGITRAVTVDCFTTTNGSAAPLLNYVSSAATVVFNPGVSAQTFYVPVLSTPTIDPPLTVPLVLSNVTGPAVLGLAQATLTIADDQVGPGVLSFSTNSYSVVEDMGVATISVVRTGGFFGAISVNFATVLGGSAPPLAKYYPTNGVLTFADGETNKSFMVGIVNNNIVEGTETVLLRLSGATGGATIAGANAVLSIIDDDTYGSFAFASAVFTVNEGGTEAAINVRRIGGANYASAVSFQTSGGTAVPGVHYTSVSNVLQFALGETNKTVQIPLGADDLTATGTRTVGLLLSNPTPTNGPVIGVPGAATLWILDHETSFSFTTNDYYISEINGNASISVARVGSTNTGASVAFSATSGTALDGLDFVGTNGVINFAPGQTVTNFLVRILRNTQVTGDRALNLTLSTPSGGGALGPIVVARLTIRDVDVALNFSAPTYVTNEGAFQAIITVVRSGATNTQTSVDYTTADGTATSTGLNANYVAAAGTLVFLPGQLTNSFNVFLLHNLIAQGDVMVLLSLLNPSGGALVGGQGAAVLTIQDMDSAVGFLSTNYVVNSQDGFANITLIRKGAVTSNDVTVFLVTSNDTAHAGVDYVRYTNVVHWAGNDMTPKTNAIVILDDGIANGAKRVGLYLLNPSTNAYVDPSQASLMIVDNGGSIAFSATTASVVEGNTLVITLLRTGGTNGEVSVQYRPIGGNATPGVDFLYPAGVVTFASGETSKSISIPVVSDGLAEGLETVLFALTNAAGGARVGSPNQMNVTIVDGDLGIVQAAGSALVKEEGSITNGMIDPNEIVTLELGLRNVGYVNTTTNFRAMLLSTNLLPGCGIVMTNNSLLATQSYGILEAGGSVVSRPFRFRAVGTNGGQITATLVLMENGLTNGTATFIFSLGGNGTTIGPASSITINDNAPASPYPSVLHVAGLVGKVNKVTVTIIGLQHGYAPDIDMILVGPQGTNVVLMSDAGSFTSADNVTITFDDAASHPLPYDTTRITNGTYIPSNYEGLNDVFPSGLGVPVPPYGTSLAVFNGSDPNGDWKLFVADDSSFFAGTIAGWSLSISNSESVASVADVSVKVAGTPNPVAMNGRLTYTLAVTNHGPGTASNVVMTNYLPVGVSGVTPSLSPSVAGSVTSDPVLNTVVASLSRLTNGQGVLMTVVVTVPGNASVLTDVATVSAASIDQYAGNNTDSVKTQVAVPPTIGTLNKPGSLVLSWPMSAGNFVLVSATNLPARPEDWIQVPNVPPPFNGTNTVSLPVGSGTMFYRLRLTP